MQIKELKLVRSKAEMRDWPEGKFLIDTVNAHSFVMACQNASFADALQHADALLPDGIAIVNACRWLKMENAPLEKIAGADLFAFEMDRLEEKGGTCFFLGSSPEVLQKIRERASRRYPHIRIETYSPPFKPVFSDEDNRSVLEAVHAARPDLLWVGMTAPKQEIWLREHWEELDIHCHAGAVGAVFDFFAGTVERAPQRWIDLGLEWLYRFIKEPGRMWRRVVISGPVFFWKVFKEALSGLLSHEGGNQQVESGE